MVRDKKTHHGNIIEAATAEFLEYGFKDASMRRIAAAAGMSASGLYKHFDSKEEMFSALVEPAFQGLMDILGRETEEQRRFVETGDSSGLETARDAKLAVSYIYDNLDAFRLIICKSQGTKYENFLHDLAVKEEEMTAAFMDVLKKQGAEIKDYSRKELHLLTTVNIGAVFETVEHDFTREEAMHYAETLDVFFANAWKAFFGY